MLASDRNEDWLREVAAPINAVERMRVLALIGRIYDAALEPERWNDVIREITEFVGGSGGQLFTAMLAFRDGGFTFSYRVPAGFHQEWQDKYINHDSWAIGAMQKGLITSGSAFLGTDCVSEAEYRQSIGHQFATRYGIDQLCCGIVFDLDLLSIPCVTCSVYRSFDEPRFGDIERTRMAVLVPHISRALGVTFRLRDAQFKTAASLSALDHLTSGVLLLDVQGNVTFLNRIARRILDEADGLTLRSRPNARTRLVTTELRLQQHIDAAIAACLDVGAINVPHFSRGVSVPRRSATESLMLQFAPLPPGKALNADGQAAHAIAFITAPEHAAAIDPQRLSDLYGLTMAESRLALRICQGDALPHAAEALQIATTTARSQLAAIFQKTGTSRQAELVKLLLAIGSVA